MLQLLLIIPLLGAVALLPFSTDAKGSSSARYLDLNSEARMKQIALFTSLLNFIISMVMWAQFDSSVSHYQFQEEFTQISFCHFHLGIDGISLYFVLLTTFITPICILSNWHDIKVGLKYFLIAFLVLETLQIAVFVVLDLLLFYIFFESVLIPLFLIVGIWGAGEARIRASFLLFLYTLAGSLFMLLAIMVIYYNVGSTDFQLISLSEISASSQKLLWLSLSFSKKDMTNAIINKNPPRSLIAQRAAQARRTPKESLICEGKSTPILRGKINKSTNLLDRFSQSNKNYLPDNNECKDLVVFGSNISSTVNYPRYTSIIRHMVGFPSNLNSILFGILMSDGWLFINKANNTLFALKQSLSKFEYVWHVFTYFSHYCNGYPRITIANLKGKKFYGVQFATRSLPCLTEWYNMFYQNKTKIVPLDLYQYLDYEALAHWIMGDGTPNNNGLTLQTQSFTVQEVSSIISVLILKFDLKCSLHMQRNQPTIYISAKSMKQISPKLQPYIIPSMRYKIFVK
jgi:hypothetical protein